MAYTVEQIHPLDLRESVGIGVGLPFAAAGVFNTTYTTAEAIKTNLINYLLTGTSERYMNPGLGVGIQELLFNQIEEDLVLQLESTIREGIAKWFPTVILTSLDVLTSPDSNTVNISLKYSIKNTNIQDQLTINVEQ